MDITTEKKHNCVTYKYVVNSDDDVVIGRAYLHVIYNDSDDMYYGLLADVHVDEKFRQQGIGTRLVMKVVEEAKIKNCKWLVSTSRYTRPHVHKWYNKLGFIDRGKEFRIDF